MRRRVDIIRDTKEARAGREACAPLRATVRRLLFFAFPLLLVCAPILRAQSGIITTVAGPQLSGSSLTNATLIQPSGVAVDSSTSSPAIYTADAYNCVVWKTQGGTTSVSAGMLAGTPYQCSGGAATSVATTTPLAYPVSVALCGGNLFIASNGLDPVLLGVTDTAGSLDEVDASGNLSVLPLAGPPGGGGGPLHPVSVACDSKGNVYVSAYYYLPDSGFSGLIDEVSPASGGGWTVSALGTETYDQAYPSIAVNPSSGDLYAIAATGVPDGWIGTPLLSVTSIQNITQNAGGVASGNSFYNADALAFDANSNLYISEAAGYQQYTSYVESVASDGTKTIIAGTGTPGYSGDGGLGTLAQVYGVDALAFDSSGNLYLADSRNQRIRRIHTIAAGPQALTLNPVSVPQSSSGANGSQQATLSPSSSVNDFYYISGANSVNVVSNGAGVISPGFVRIVATIPVGASGVGGASQLTMIADPTRNLIYIDNLADGNLYVIDGSYGTSTSHTVVGRVALDNANASLLAIDTGLNEVYVAGPNSTNMSAVRGGASPQLIGNAGFPAAFVSSLSVNSASHVVYAVSDTGAGNGQEEALITLTPDPQTGALTASDSVFPEDEDILQPAFIANSIAVDPITGSLIASGAASIDPGFGQTYETYDIFHFTPEYIAAPVPLTWPPITTSLDVPNRAFYLTDFDGTLSDPSSHGQMVTGIDSVFVNNNTLTSISIPIFGSGTTPSSPHVYDVEPDTSSYQAWISGSDATDGGFVKLWDSTTQQITATVTIPNSGGGHLFVDSGAHAGYLLDEVNGLLWLINTLPWTTIGTPTLTQSQGGQSVTIAAVNSGDQVYYTVNGTSPGLGSTPCSSSCTVNLTQGVFTTINAIEVAVVAGTQYAGNVAQGIFTAPAPTTTSLTLTTNQVGTGASDVAIATISPGNGVSSVSGTVTFTATIAGSSTPVTLCSQASVQNNTGDWQATCSFIEAAVGSYTITSNYSGDALNESSSGTASLTVFQGVTPVLATLSGDSNPLAINANSSPSLAFNAVLNSDSSVTLVQNGAILSGQGCPAFPALAGGLTNGAVYVDAANSRIYLAMLTSSALYSAYESLGPQGICTQGPLLQFSGQLLNNLEINVDTTQGNMYVLNSGGAFPDSLYILPTAPWSASQLPTPSQVTLDYSVTYGPILIDPSNHQVYINDLGGSTFGSAGTYTTSGFFVYDPNQSTIPANNLQHVVGYISGGAATPFNVGTLLDNGTGKLVLINENPNWSSANLTVPITILDTTQFSFFTKTSNPYTYNNDVDITPGAGLSTISATAQYSALGGADINASSGLVYTYAYNANNVYQPGMLLEYNLSPSASSPETVLSSGTAMPALYDSLGPWSQLNYNSESTELVLSANAEGSGALGIITPLCAGIPSLTQLLGNAGSPTPVNSPVINMASGYVYAIQPPSSAPASLDYVAPPPTGCSTSTPIQISPAALPSGVVGAVYAQTLTATGGSGTGYTWTVTSGTGLSAVGLSLSPAGTISGTPTAAETGASVTVKVTDSQGNSATETYTLTIYPALSISPASLPTGTVGIAYSQALTATGGSGAPYTWSVTAGTALSAAGLTLSSTGIISGTPTTSETAASVTVQVKDSQGNNIAQSYQFTINSGSIAIAPSALPPGIVGTAYSEALIATGGSGTGYTWTVTAGTAFSAAGLTLSSGGIISGAPAGPETAASVMVQVKDSQGNIATQTYQLTVYPALSISPATLLAGIIGSNYSQTLTASGGSGTGYTWTVTAGTALSAAGLTLSPAGTISGTPTAAETSASVTVKVTDSLGNSAMKIYALTIYSALSISPASLPAGTAGIPYSQALTATGGSGAPYTWSVYSGAGSLSALDLSLSGNTIQGTPSAGQASFVVQVTDSLGDSGTMSYQLTVSATTAAASIIDNETIIVSDGPPQVQLIDVNDSPETITVTDTVSVTASNQDTISLRALPTGSVNFGERVIFEATVRSVSGGTPTGTVTFTVPGSAPTTVSLSRIGIAVDEISTLPLGMQTVAAIYNGGTGFAPSAPVAIQIDVVAPTRF